MYQSSASLARCEGNSLVTGGASFFFESSQRTPSRPEKQDMWCSIVNMNMISALHYGDAIMGAMASQMTSLTIVYSTVNSGADQMKHQSSASLATNGQWRGRCFHLMTSPRPISCSCCVECRLVSTAFSWWFVAQPGLGMAIQKAHHLRKCSKPIAMHQNSPNLSLLWCIYVFKTHWAQSRWPLFSRLHFQMDVCEWICMNFD